MPENARPVSIPDRHRRRIPSARSASGRRRDTIAEQKQNPRAPAPAHRGANPARRRRLSPRPDFACDRAATAPCAPPPPRPTVRPTAARRRPPAFAHPENKKRRRPRGTPFLSPAYKLLLFCESSCKAGFFHHSAFLPPRPASFFGSHGGNFLFSAAGNAFAHRSGKDTIPRLFPRKRNFAANGRSNVPDRSPFPSGCFCAGSPFAPAFPLLPG